MGKQSRKTKQKELLEQEFKKFTTLFTAEELYENAHVQDDTIGIATVYRFLKDKKSSNGAHSYVCDRRTLYSKEKNSHCHFICQKCGNTYDFDIAEISHLKRQVKGEICHFQIEVQGICNSCSA